MLLPSITAKTISTNNTALINIIQCQINPIHISQTTLQSSSTLHRNPPTTRERERETLSGCLKWLRWVLGLLPLEWNLTYRVVFCSSWGSHHRPRPHPVWGVAYMLKIYLRIDMCQFRSPLFSCSLRDRRFWFDMSARSDLMQMQTDDMGCNTVNNDDLELYVKTFHRTFRVTWIA